MKRNEYGSDSGDGMIQNYGLHQERENVDRWPEHERGLRQPGGTVGQDSYCYGKWW
jgi:hypothetical protein